MKKILILVLVFPILLLSGCNLNRTSQLVGSDRDQYGCINSAGYTWCATKQKCLRSWEEKCEIIKPNSYRNEEYGFEITLPDSWQGYSSSTELWHGQLVVDGDEKFQGPKIIIRNPKWTASQPWQDLPIMVFNQAEWKLISEEALAVSAAPIGPSKLGENQKYIFATPPRWLGFTDNLGQDEAAEIMKTFKTF